MSNKPWTWVEWVNEAELAGWSPVYVRDLFGERSLSHLEHENGATFDPHKVDANDQPLWQQYAAAHQTPPPF